MHNHSSLSEEAALCNSINFVSNFTYEFQTGGRTESPGIAAALQHLVCDCGAQPDRISLAGIPTSERVTELAAALGSSASVLELMSIGRSPETSQAAAIILGAAFGGAESTIRRLVLKDLYAMTGLAAALAGNVRMLTRVTLVRCRESDNSQTTLHALKQAPGLQEIDWEFMGLMFIETKTLGDVFPRGLLAIRLKRVALDAEDARLLGAALSRCGLLRTLVITGSLTSHSMTMFVKGLLCRPGTFALRKLKMISIVAEDTGLAGLVKRCDKLERVDFSKTALSKASGEGVAKALCSCVSEIRRLDLPECGLSDDAVASVFCSLSGSHLGWLNLALNHAGRLSAISASEMLPRCPMLASLNLSSNALGDYGAKQLAKGTSKSNSLEELDVEANDIWGNGAVQIIDSLSPLTVQILRISDNPIGDKGAEALSRMITRSHCIRTVLADSCDIRVRGATAIANSVRDSESMRELGLRHIRAEAEGATAIAEGVIRKGRVEVLNLSYGILEEEGVRAVLRAITASERERGRGARQRTIRIEGCNCRQNDPWAEW